MIPVADLDDFPGDLDSRLLPKHDDNLEPEPEEEFEKIN